MNARISQQWTGTAVVCGLCALLVSGCAGERHSGGGGTTAVSGWNMQDGKKDTRIAGYERGMDSGVKHSGNSSAYIRATGEPAPSGFAPITQGISAKPYLGKRVRLTGWLKTEKADGAGLWMRIDGANNKLLGFDNMQQGRSVQGSNSWKAYSVVLDVPQESEAIVFGALLIGSGKIWVDDLTIEEVDPATTPVTQPGAGNLPSQPSNLDFER